MPRRKNIEIIGAKFGKLTIIEFLDKISKRTRVRCLCDCGKHKDFDLQDIKRGSTTSCGCLKKDYDGLIGKRFNRLIIKSFDGVEDGLAYVIAICDCGVEKRYLLASLKSGNTNSCGCFKVSKSFKHGLSKHPLHKVWWCMLSRCYDKRDKRYDNYGGRGVSVSARWRNDFKAFYDWAIDKWKPGLELDKDIRSGDIVGDFYCPELCCFITSKENSRHRSSNVRIEYLGETKCLSEWCEKFNLPYQAIRKRINMGWDMNKIFSEPIKKRIPA
jgi:hypothetical protein